MLLWLKKKKKVVLRHILCKKVTPPQQLSPRYCLLQFKNPCKACSHTCFLWSCSSSAFALTVNHRSCDVSSRSPPHKTTQRQTHNTHRHKDNTQCPTMYSTHTQATPSSLIGWRCCQEPLRKREGGKKWPENQNRVRISLPQQQLCRSDDTSAFKPSTTKGV